MAWRAFAASDPEGGEIVDCDQEQQDEYVSRNPGDVEIEAGREQQVFAGWLRERVEQRQNYCEEDAEFWGGEEHLSGRLR